LKIYSMLKFGVTPVINALSTVVVLVTLVIILGAGRFLTGDASDRTS
jgi:spermidine/putrescine transport system permease protein